MAAGERYNTKLKAKAMAMLEADVPLSTVAKQMKIPKSTLHLWKEKFKDDKEIVTGVSQRDERSELQKKLDFIEEVELFKKQFTNIAQENTLLSGELVNKRLKKALDAEKEIEKLIEMVSKNEELSNVQRKEIIVQLKQIKIEDISKLAVVSGTFYDKQALANKEATSIVDGNITVKKFEDF